VDRGTSCAIYFGIFANSVFYVITFFIDVTRCKTCLLYSAFPWATGIFNMISDFYILLLPMPLIFGMLMPLARRIRIASIFGLGLL
jgi:hypothetical protein